EHVLQTMPELVEERLDLVKTHQCGLAANGRGLVADQVGHRETHRLPWHRQNAAAPDALVHPRPTALLGRSAVGVQVEGRHRPLLIIVNTEEAHVLVPYRCFSIGWANLHAKEALYQGEQTIEHTRQWKIRPQFFVVKIVALLTQALGPKCQVPMAQGLCLSGAGCASALPEVFQVLLR